MLDLSQETQGPIFALERWMLDVDTIKLLSTG